MHEHGVVHRVSVSVLLLSCLRSNAYLIQDISAGNILMNYVPSSKSRTGCVSLQHEPLTLSFIDFGHSERCEGPASSWESSTCSGTYDYTAPEILRMCYSDFVEPDPASAPKDAPRTFRLVPVDVGSGLSCSRSRFLTMIFPGLRNRGRF